MNMIDLKYKLNLILIKMNITSIYFYIDEESGSFQLVLPWYDKTNDMIIPRVYSEWNSVDDFFNNSESYCSYGYGCHGTKELYEKMTKEIAERKQA